jgi:hypothetical protein
VSPVIAVVKIGSMVVTGCGEMKPPPFAKPDATSPGSK